MIVTVDSVHMEGHSTIAYGVGRSERDELVHFAGDWRPMREVGLAIERGEVVDVEVEPWQILTIIPPEAA